MAHKQPNPSLLPQLRGAPVSVLLALASGERNRDELVTLTAYSPNIVTRALNTLVEMGLATRLHYRRWALASGVDIRALFHLPPPPLPEPQRQDPRPTKPAPPVPSPQESVYSFSDIEKALLGVSDDTGSSDFSPPQNANSRRLSTTPQSDFSTPQSANSHRLSTTPQSDFSAPQSANSHPSSPPVHDHLAAPQSANSYPSAAKMRNLAAKMINAPRPEKSFATPSAPQNAKNGLSARQNATSDPSPHDVGVINNTDHLDNLEQKNQQQTPQFQRLARESQFLNPPFSDPAAWLKTVPLDLVDGWLRHLGELDYDARCGIRNQSAFLRAKVDARQQPPPSRHARRPPCPDCGKPYFDRDGLCLVCAGVVKV